MQQYEIEEFWIRFQNHVEFLKLDPYEPDFVKFIDDTMLNWNVSWEIGPGKIKEFSLTISPGGTFDLIEKVIQIISKAPSLDDWEFYGFKQPKENWFLANLLDRKINVNANGWTHQLLQYPEGNFELMLKADNIRQYDLESQELIVDLVITNLLGEELKMKEITSIKIIDWFENDRGTTKLEYLPYHLARIKNGS